MKVSLSYNTVLIKSLIGSSEDYDEGAADALLGLAGYRSSAQAKEPANILVQPNIDKSTDVPRLEPQQISSNVMSANTPSLKRATTSSPPAEGSHGRDGKKARYESPGKDAASVASTALLSPSARSVPSAISIPARTVTTMIEVLNPSRITPTATSPMTANAPVSPSRRDKEGKPGTPSPRKRSQRSLSTSPKKKVRTEGDQEGEKGSDKNVEKTGDLDKKTVMTLPSVASKQASEPSATDATGVQSTQSQPAETRSMETVAPEIGNRESRNSPKLPSPTPAASLAPVVPNDGVSTETQGDNDTAATDKVILEKEEARIDALSQENDVKPIRESEKEQEKQQERENVEEATSQPAEQLMDTSA